MSTSTISRPSAITGASAGSRSAQRPTSFIWYRCVAQSFNNSSRCSRQNVRYCSRKLRLSGGCGSPARGKDSDRGDGRSLSTSAVAAAENRSAGSRSAAIVAASASNSGSARRASNCAAVNRQEAGDPGGDQAAAIAAACWATTAAWLPPLKACSPLRPVAAVEVVSLHPLLGHDRGAQGELAAQHGGGDDLGELADVVPAVAAEQLEAFPLRGETRPTAVRGHDQGGDRDRVVVIAVVSQFRVDVGRGG